MWRKACSHQVEPDLNNRHARVNQTTEATHALDERMVNMVAASPAGLIAQVELLAMGEHEQPIVDDDLADRLVASIIAGIKALTAPADDSIILGLFWQWVDAKRRSWAVPEAEYEAAGVAADEIEDAIIATPSSGAAGLAIKTYFMLHIDNRHDEDAAALGHELNWPALQASILRDMIRFVPELAPLVHAAVEP